MVHTVFRGPERYQETYDAMKKAKQGSLYIASVEVEKINTQLENFNLVSDFARQLKLPKGSEIEREMEKYLQQIEELNELAVQRTREYPNLGIYTVASDTIE